MNGRCRGEGWGLLERNIRIVMDLTENSSSLTQVM